MGRKSVAVLDIRSYEVSLYIGERGVNHTIQFIASKTEAYDGYSGGEFFNVKNLAAAVAKLMEAVSNICPAPIRTLYVGVPGEFIKLVTREQTLGFTKRRKVTEEDVSLLFEKGKEEIAAEGATKGYRFVRATSMIYVTSDNRRVVDPIGQVASSLRGCLSYFYCTEYFIRTIEGLFPEKKLSFRYLPTPLAMANALIPSETRDEYALFLDVGMLSSTVMLLLGGGVMEQATFPVGRMSVIYQIFNTLKVKFSAAEPLLGRVNLNARADAPTGPSFEFLWEGKTYFIDEAKLVNCVKEGLDEICMPVSGFLEANSDLVQESRPLFISGEGLVGIRGALEHISSKRLFRVCDMIAPNQPYYNKPAMSSRIALVGMAYDDNLKEGLFHRLFKGYRR